jgi:hypothetical protein
LIGGSLQHDAYAPQGEEQEDARADHQHAGRSKSRIGALMDSRMARVPCQPASALIGESLQILYV